MKIRREGREKTTNAECRTKEKGGLGEKLEYLAEQIKRKKTNKQNLGGEEGCRFAWEPGKSCPARSCIDYLRCQKVPIH